MSVVLKSDTGIVCLDVILNSIKDFFPVFINTPNFFTGTVNYRPDTQRILAYNLITHARLADVSRDNSLLRVNETINITLLPGTIAEINKFLWSLFNVPNLSFILITKTHKPIDRQTDEG